MTILTRTAKGAPLTYVEMDANLTELAGGLTRIPENVSFPAAPSAEVVAYESHYADTTDAAKGSGAVGFNPALPYGVGTVGRRLNDLATTYGGGLVGFDSAETYPASTVGKRLTDLASGVGAGLLGYLAPLTGAVVRTLAQIIGDFPVSAKWFGAVGNGTADDTAAIQAWLNNLIQGTVVLNAAQGNFALALPRGTYRITGTITLPNSASQFKLIGDGQRASVFKWDGAAGVPMFKCINMRQAVFQDIGFVGKAGSAPSYLMQVHRDSGQVGPGAPTENSFIRCWFGGDSSNMAAVGVGFTAESITYDANNDRAYFQGCNFDNLSQDGISFEHGNSLVHTIIACGFANCARSAINAVHTIGSFDSSFVSYSCTSSGCGSTWRLGGTTHAVTIVGWMSEGDTDILAMPAAASSTYPLDLSLIGVSWKGGTGSAAFKFDGGVNSSLKVSGGFFTSPSGIACNFPTTGSKVSVDGCLFNFASVTYNNDVFISRDVITAVGNPTWTNSGSGYRRSQADVLFSTTATTTVANTVTETGIISGSTAIGARSIPANSMYIGRSYRVKLAGFMADAGTPTLRAKLYLGVAGATMVWDSGLITLPTLPGTSEFDAEFVITCTALGASGSVIAQGGFFYNNGAARTALAGTGTGYGNSTAIDTTTNNIVDLKVQWGTASGSNFITRTNCIIEALN